MKLRKFISLAVASAIVMTNAIVFSISTASAATVNTDTAYSEDFEGYGEMNQQTTLQTLKNSGWYACDHTQLFDNVAAVAPYSTMNYKLADVGTVDGSKVLRIVTAGQRTDSKSVQYGYGRALPGVAKDGAATGVYNIQFDYKPVLVGEQHLTQAYFGLNTADGSAANDTDAQHNIFSAYNQTFYMGFRNHQTIMSSGITQDSISAVKAGGAIWYTIKATVDCDNHYYSVEVYNRSTGKLIARRSPISFAGNESVGFIKFSALGYSNSYSFYIDNITIEKTTRNTLIYEDKFEYGSAPTATEAMTVNGDSEDIKGSSYFEGYTPWRAVNGFGNAYGLTDGVLRLGDDPETDGTTEKSGLAYVPAREMLLANAAAQQKLGKVKVSFKIKPATIGSTPFQIYSMYDHTTGNASKVFEIADNGGNPAINGVDLDASTWYDADVVLDPANKAATVTLKNHSTQAVVTEFNHGFSKLTAIKGIMFNVAGGTTVYMDDAKIEYFEADPTYDASKIVITDKSDNAVSGTTEITTEVKSISIPFGCDLDGTTASTSTILLKDSSDNTVAYTADRFKNAYTMTLSEDLAAGETYTLTIPSTVANIFGVALGGSDRTFTFTTEAGVEEINTETVLDEAVDKAGETVVLTENGILDIGEDLYFRNGYVDATNGYIRTGDRKITGSKVRFTSEGKISVDDGYSAKISRDNEDETKDQGFIFGLYNPTGIRTVILDVTGGEHDGKTVEKDFDFTGWEIYGLVNFGFEINAIPTAVDFNVKSF